MAIAPIMTKKFRISQKYWNKLILNGKEFYKQFWFAWHMGIDYGIPVGTELLAWLEGEITVKNDGKSGYGLSVSISKQRKDGSSWIIYAHLSETKLITGDKVKVWDIIGKSGNTGASTWPHLHFGLRMRNLKGEVINYDNGYKGRVDPQGYFENGKYSIE